jgi:FKBP-type peptidyl-prolyl cis-trans isomerase 2
LERGSFVKIRFHERAVTTGRITDTNIEEVARDAGIFDAEEADRYRPLALVVGSGRPTKGVDEQLFDMEVGESREFVVPPAKAYGRRDPKLVNMVQLSYLRKRGINPVRGLPVRTRRGIAIIRSTAGGRVILDYNHPLAGQSMSYNVEIVEKAEDPETKIRWLLGLLLRGIDPESHIVEVQGERARLDLNTADLSPAAEEQLRALVRRDISENLPEITEVVFGPEEGTEEEGESPQAGGAEVAEPGQGEPAPGGNREKRNGEVPRNA